jgi:hypothetical protein
VPHAREGEGLHLSAIPEALNRACNIGSRNLKEKYSGCCMPRRSFAPRSPRQTFHKR